MASTWKSPVRLLRDGPEKVEITYQYPDEDQAFEFLKRRDEAAAEGKPASTPGDRLDDDASEPAAPTVFYSRAEIQTRAELARALVRAVAVDGIEVPGGPEAAQGYVKADARFVHLLVADSGWLFRLSPDASPE